MEQNLSPSKALQRRHTAAMEIVNDLLPAERVKILCYVVGWLQDKEIDLAVEEAEKIRLDRAMRGEKAPRRRSKVGV